MSATLVLTIVSPDSIQCMKDLLLTNPQTGAIPDPLSRDHIARYITGVADGSIANTSVTITSIS